MTKKKTKKKKSKKSTIKKVELAEPEPEKSKSEEQKPRKKIIATFLGERVITEDSDEARELNHKSVFGTIENEKVYLSLIEALYLFEKNRIEILDGRKKKVEVEKFVKKAQKLEPNFWIRYIVFKDMRNRGYVVKTALKFGADFRVYERGIKPGEDHARWILYPVDEASTITWYEFAAKNRVAHSTKKRILIAVVDAENDVSYWEIRWMRP
ncbi:tRNA-intron lyase [Nanoarchaeota archaeon]